MRFVPEINTVTKEFLSFTDNNWYQVFNHGEYSSAFVSCTNFNVLKGGMYYCYGKENFYCNNHYFKKAIYGEENLKTKIRLTDLSPIKWKDSYIPRYMRKSKLEKQFKIKLSFNDQCDSSLLAGFYIKSTNGGLYGIFDTIAVLKRYRNLMEIKWGDEWKSIRVRVLLKG